MKTMRTNKLFALENLDEELVPGEGLEVSPEVGEVADVQVDVDAEVAEVVDAEAAISEGTEAGDQLEEVGEVMEKALEEGEGLDPIAAEAISLAIKAICGRIGAPASQITSMTAFENFASPSSRRANTKFALEGVGEFLKNLWERIKAAIAGLWKKMEAFWNKHASSLGRLLKALESAKISVSGLKGAPSFDSIDVPGGLKAIFPVKGNLGEGEVSAYLSRLEAAKDSYKSVFDKIDDTATLSLVNIAGVVRHKFAKASGVDVTFGDENSPIAGGKHYKWVFKAEPIGDGEGNDKTYRVEVEEDHGEFTGSDKPQLEVAGKDKLKSLITSTITEVKAMVKFRDTAEKRSKDMSKALTNIGKEISATKSEMLAADMKHNMRAFQVLMTKGPMLEAKLFSTSINTFKGVMMFVDACAKNHKGK